MSSSLERFRSLLGHLERSRGKSRRVSKGKRRNPPAVKNPIDRKTFEGIADDSTFNRGYRPGLVPDSMRRGPNVRDIDLIGRPDRQVPGVRYDRIGDHRIPEFPGYTQPGGGRNNDAKSPAGRGKGKDFEKMLRSRMSGF
jgi:hypothetical protein